MAKVTLKNVILSYPHVWDPHTFDDGQAPKYSACLIFSKDDKKNAAAFKKAFDITLQEAKKGQMASKFKNHDTRLPLRDGDKDREDDPNYSNSYFVNANSKRKPQIVDKQVQPILDRDEIYPGCICNVSVNLYPYSRSGNTGIAVGLGNIQKVKDGIRLDGGTTASQDFEVIEDDDDEDIFG